MDYYFDEVVRLGLLGMKKNEIALELDVDACVVNYNLRLLNMPKSKHYNPFLYNQIIFAMGLNNMVIYDKDFLLLLVDKVLNGYTLLEVAVLTDSSISYINKHLSYLEKDDKCLYDKLKKAISLNDKQDYGVLMKKLSKLEDEYNFVNKEKFNCNLLRMFKKWLSYGKMVELFLANPLIGPKDLALYCDVSFETITNILLMKDKHQFLKCMYGDEALKIKALFEEARLKRINDRHSFEGIDSKKCDEKITKAMKNVKFWVSFMREFSLSLEQLMMFLQIEDKETFKRKMLLEVGKESKIYEHALNYALAYSEYDEENLKKAQLFWKKYVLARKANLPLAKKMYDKVMDTDYKRLVESKKSIRMMSDDEKKIVAHHWVKYAIPGRWMPFYRKDLQAYCAFYADGLEDVFEFNINESRKYYRMKR